MVKRKEVGGERYSVPALARGMKILEYLAGRPEGASAVEVAAAMKLPKPSVFRMLLTLADGGYLAKDEELAQYRLSRKLLSLGYAAIDGRGLLERAMDSLRALRDESGESSKIAVLCGNEGIVLDQLPGRNPVTVMVQIGHRFPLHTAAPGKAMVAFLPEAERGRILGAIEYKRFTATTITSRAALEAELAKVRETGVAYDMGEELEELRCVSAPVLNHVGYPIAAVWIGGTASSIKDEALGRLSKMVAKHAKDISNRFSI